MIASAGSEIGADWQPDAAPWDGSRRLWSLWEIMKYVKVGEIISNLHKLGKCSFLINASKNPLHIDHYKNSAKIYLQALLVHFEELNFVVPTEYTKEMLRAFDLSIDAVSGASIDQLAAMIANTTEMECRKKIFFEMDTRLGRYYDGVNLFGEDFVNKFPDAIFELDEAGKCFALNRPTAAVFHLMRLMEISIRAVARCLKVANPAKPSQRNWGTILRALKCEIDKKTSAAGWRAAGDKEFFESAYGSLDAVRIAWRNPTMHVENKYTNEEAEHIFIAVGGLMKKITSRIDQNGIPHA